MSRRAPDFLELPGHLVDVLLGLDAQLAGALRHLDRVFVVAHQEVDAIALHPAESSLHVGPDLLERGADVRAAVGIVDRRRDEEWRVVVHRPNPRLPVSPEASQSLLGRHARRPRRAMTSGQAGTVRGSLRTRPGPIYHTPRARDEATTEAGALRACTPARRGALGSERHRPREPVASRARPIWACPF